MMIFARALRNLMSVVIIQIKIPPLREVEAFVPTVPCARGIFFCENIVRERRKIGLFTSLFRARSRFLPLIALRPRRRSRNASVHLRIAERESCSFALRI